MKHNIVLKGYGAYLPTTPSKLLRLGTAESYGVEKIHITPGADWENLLIKATFHPPSGDSVVVILGEDGVIDVPPEATAVAAGEYNPGVIVFSGVADGVQRISANLAYTVIGHASVDGKDPEPTPSQWEQLAVQYQSKVDKQQGAENAGKVLGIGADGMVVPVEQTGGDTKAGVTFTPAVSEEGVISWTNDGDLPNPEPVNIKGPAGKDGDDYVLTEADKQEIAQEAADLVDVPDKLPNPHALTFTGAVSGTYDGSAPLTVEIPEGGSGGGFGDTVEIFTQTFTEETQYFYRDMEWEKYAAVVVYIDQSDNTKFYMSFKNNTTYAINSKPLVNCGDILILPIGTSHRFIAMNSSYGKTATMAGNDEFIVTVPVDDSDSGIKLYKSSNWKATDTVVCKGVLKA